MSDVADTEGMQRQAMVRKAVLYQGKAMAVERGMKLTELFDDSLSGDMARLRVWQKLRKSEVSMGITPHGLRFIINELLDPDDPE